MPIDQVSSLFSAPFTTDISIVKMDVHGGFTQVKSLPNLNIATCKLNYYNYSSILF